MYINGELVGTNNNMTFKPSDLGVTVNNYIGQSQWLILFDGKIDDFSIYDNALSAEEIKALTITGVSDIEVTTVTGEAPVLPDSVAVDYHDGTSGIATVIWLKLIELLCFPRRYVYSGRHHKVLP